MLIQLVSSSSILCSRSLFKTPSPFSFGEINKNQSGSEMERKRVGTTIIIVIAASSFIQGGQLCHQRQQSSNRRPLQLQLLLLLFRAIKQQQQQVVCYYSFACIIVCLADHGHQQLLMLCQHCQIRAILMVVQLKTACGSVK